MLASNISKTLGARLPWTTGKHPKTGPRRETGTLRLLPSMPSPGDDAHTSRVGGKLLVGRVWKQWS